MTALDWFTIIIWSMVGGLNIVSCINKDKCSWPTFWLTYVAMMIYMINFIFYS